jgi:hypothetical protein
MTKYVYSPGLGKRVEVEELDTGAKPSKARQRKRARLTTTWARIPHHHGIKLAKRDGNPVLAVLLALEHLVHGAKSNRIKFTNDLLKQYKIAPQSKSRGLRRLAAAGVITIEQDGKAAPVVTHLWYTKGGKLRKGCP